PARGWSTTGFIESFTLGPNLSTAVRELGRDHRATPAMVMLAAYTGLLAAESGRDEVLLGTFHLNRSRPEVEPLVGLFVNVLMLRTDCSGNPSFSELVGRVRQVMLGALSHADLPIDQLIALPGGVEAVNCDRHDWLAFHFL